MPSRPAIASRCTTALVDPPIAASATIALGNDLGQDVLGRRLLDHLDGQPTRLVRREQPAVGGGSAGEAGKRHAERLCDDRHRGGRAHRVAVALAADQDSDSRNRSSDIVPARTSSLSLQTSVPQPSGAPRKSR